MKLLLAFLSLFLTTSTSIWLTDFAVAQKIAKEKNQLILLNFSGSDWCGPCIRMKKEIFGNQVFNDYATPNLVLVNADFPRNKKNKLNKDQVKLNEALADKYNPEGKFPYTLLLDADGKVLKKWDGFPNERPEDFVASIKIIVNAGR